MPLLGRHKSLPGGNQTKDQKQQQSPPVCESPLFGTRRQLPSATTPVASASLVSSRQSTGKHQSLSARNSSSATAASSTSADTLGSIPKQITRQQIHYAFSIMDANSDGLIDLRDLSQMLANLGVPIDEAILAHVISSVSKRGDHRISELEFLHWIGNFIQVSDLEAAGQSTGPSACKSSSSPLEGAPALLARRPGGGAVLRSASSSTGLVARTEVELEASLNKRRGSGSGLALMRSLSSSNAASRSSGSSDRLEPGDSGPAQKQAQLAEQQLEARADLKAAFCVFDLDGDGFITIDEVQQGLKLLGESWSQAELNQLLFTKCQQPATIKNNDAQVAAKKATRKQQSDLASGGHKQQEQRINIDDFVKLLL